MKSNTRHQCEESVFRFAQIINSSQNYGDLLYVGVAGDPVGGEYAPLFTNFACKTFDIDPIWNPDICGDITKTSFLEESWDAIVCVQTMEHIPNVFELPAELRRILKIGGYAIVDCPWNYPYHGEPSFGDYWRISKDGMRALFEKHFNIVEIDSGSYNTSCLLQKL